MDLLLTLAGLVLLVAGAEWLVRGAVAMALRARLSPLVVGLTVVSMGTSAPELVVSVAAAFKGSPVIALGNVVGSNIANISLILGAAVLVFPIAVERSVWRIHTPVMIGASLLLLILFADDRLSRWEALLLLVLIIGYMVLSIRAARCEVGEDGAKAGGSPPMWPSILRVAAGVAGLAVGATWFVEGALAMATTYGLSEGLVGLTIVAVGTSMPEFVTSLLAAFRRQADISLGNLVGSNIFNILGILGITALVKPIITPPGAFSTDLWVMTALALLVYLLMRMGLRMGRWQGGVLLLAYAGYLALVVSRG